jgi:hypothetical protein
VNADDIPTGRELTAAEFLSLLPADAKPYIPEVDDSNDEPEHEQCDGCETCELATQLAEERIAHGDLRNLCAQLADAWGGWHGADLLHLLTKGTLPARYDNPTARHCTDGPQGLDAYRGPTDEHFADIHDHLHRRRPAEETR